MKLKRFAAAAAACCICAASAGIQASAAASSDEWQSKYRGYIKNAVYETLSAQPYSIYYWNLYDIDSNGIPELLLANQPDIADGTVNIDVLYYNGNSVAKAGSFLQTGDGDVPYFPFAVPGQGQLVSINDYDGARSTRTETTVYQFNGTTLTQKLTFAMDSDGITAPDFSVNDESVEYDEYNRYESQYNPDTMQEVILYNANQLLNEETELDKWWDAVEEGLKINRDSVSDSWRIAYINFLEETAFDYFTDREQEDIRYEDETNYSLIDFNQDGIPELVLANRDDIAGMDNVPDVYTCKNGAVMPVETEIPASFGEVIGWGNIYSGLLMANEQSGYYYDSNDNYFFKFDGTKLVMESAFIAGNEYCYNGNQVSKDAFDAALAQYDSVKRGGHAVQFEYAIGDIMPVLNYQAQASQNPTDTETPDNTNNNQNTNNNNTNNNNSAGNNTNNTTGKTGTSSAPKTGDAGIGIAAAVLFAAAGAAVLASAKRKHN